MCETAAKRKTGDKQRRMVELAVSAEEAASLTEKRSSPQRREAVRLLAAEGRMACVRKGRYPNMTDITAIGEILIDLTQTGVNEAGVPLFAANPGGAPANFLAPPS